MRVTVHLTTHFLGQAQHHNYHRLTQNMFSSMISFHQVTRVNLLLLVKLPDLLILHLCAMHFHTRRYL